MHLSIADNSCQIAKYKIVHGEIMASKTIFVIAALSFFVIFTTATQSFADEGIKVTEQIKKNPVQMQMLKKIELSKKILAEMQNEKKVQNEKALKIAEMRKEAKARLNAEVTRMNVEYDQYTPKNAFTKFVSKKPAETHGVYWAMFNYQQEKVKSAKDARDQVLARGGTTQEAWDAYHKTSAINRVKAIELNKEYNIKYGGADASVQYAFDRNGKLPRTD